MGFFTKLVLSLLVVIPGYLQNGCQNKGGYCLDVNQYICDFDEYPIKGYCPGPANIQCCIKAVSPTCSNKGGRCRQEVWCNYVGGKTITGLCPGPSNMKCCIE